MGESARGGMPVLYVVIPCFNEEDALPITADVLWKLMGRLVSEGHVAAGSRVLLVDDGSKDRTWEAIRALHDDPSYGDLFCGISLAHNRGHQAALLAGLMTAYEWGCDCAVSMDADLQDDPEVIADMLAEYEAGAEVVFGVRSSRETDTLFKRCTASAFYRLFNALGAEAVPDSADFRLMGRRSLSALLDYPEANLFLRGLVAQLGFETAQVRYRRAARTAGESKYPLRKMVAFAADGITSFSVVPLRLIVAAGMGFVLLAVAMLVYVLVSLVAGHTVSGWSSLMISLWFIGGAIMVSLGVVGEYVGKTYLESKRRPRWVVAEELR